MLPRPFPFVIAAVGVASLGLAGPVGWGQEVHRGRATDMAGPQGRSWERRIEIDRRPGSAERRLRVERPGGSLERQTVIQRVPPAGRPRPWGPAALPGLVIERQVVVAPRPGPSWAFGFAAAPVLALPFWQAEPPPIVVATPPAGVIMGALAPPQPSAVAASPLDPVVLAAQRLQSLHAGSRREAAQTLGRLGDPRAVPALVHLLKHDSSRQVRIEAAVALGAIGGKEAETVLERCIIYEKKAEVREAAAQALQRLRDRQLAAGPTHPPRADTSSRPGLEPPPPPPTTAPRRWSPAPSRTPQFQPPLEGPEDPPLEGEIAQEDLEPTEDPLPPPPPTPVQPSTRDDRLNATD